VAATRCSECDEGPDEDAGLGRRRGAARAAAEQLNAPLPDVPAGDVDPAAWPPLLRNHLPDMVAACAAVAGDEDDGEGLAAVVDSLRETTAAAFATPRHRPWRRGWSQLDALLDALDGATRCWVEALRSAMPEEVKRLCRSAQEAIDEAAELLEQWTAANDLEEALEARLGDGELATLEVLVDHVVASRSVTDVDAEGAELFERVVGSRDRSDGLGIGLLITEAQVHTVMDGQRFWNNAREAFGLLKPGMSQITSSDAWLVDMLELAGELHEAAMQIQLNVARLDRPDVLARTVVRTGHVLTERSVSPSTCLPLCWLRTEAVPTTICEPETLVTLCSSPATEAGAGSPTASTRP
jgi:hypothetical protein